MFPMYTHNNNNNNIYSINSSSSSNNNSQLTLALNVNPLYFSIFLLQALKHTWIKIIINNNYNNTIEGKIPLSLFQIIQNVTDWAEESDPTRISRFRYYAIFEPPEKSRSRKPRKLALDLKKRLDIGGKEVSNNPGYFKTEKKFVKIIPSVHLSVKNTSSFLTTLV